MGLGFWLDYIVCQNDHAEALTTLRLKHYEKN